MISVGDIVVRNVLDSSLLNVSRTAYHAMPMSPVTDALHGAGDAVVSPFVDPTSFDIRTRFGSNSNEDIFC